MEIKDLVREIMFAEIIAERNQIILNQQKIIDELKNEYEMLKQQQNAITI